MNDSNCSEFCVEVEENLAITEDDIKVEENLAITEEAFLDCCSSQSATEDTMMPNPSHVEERSHEDDDDESSFQSAVAASSALVGENVLDSPELSPITCRKMTHNTMTAAAAPPPPPAPPLTADAPPDVTAGLMAQGLAWARTQREKRRRRYLQNQADRQLEKLRKAQQAAAEKTPSRSLLDNPIFQNFDKALRGNSNNRETTTTTTTKNTGESGDNEQSDSSNNNKDDSFSSSTTGAAFVSPSGDGYSASLPVSPKKEEEEASFIPPVRVEEESELELSPYILTQDEMQQIAAHVLPRGISYCRWKRLYSLARDGDSFDACLRYIQNHDRTLMVVRTSRNAVLGGFAESAWQVHVQGGARYYGGPAACLFKVINNNNNNNNNNKPDNSRKVVKHFKWTGKNRYIQLCDITRKMLAFGGGGDDGAFGLSVEQDFQVGSTGPCATFDNEPLCDQENFTIVDMEIFGFLVGQF